LRFDKGLKIAAPLTAALHRCLQSTHRLFRAWDIPIIPAATRTLR
jgi:hypothetical protein